MLPNSTMQEVKYYEEIDTVLAQLPHDIEDIRIENKVLFFFSNNS